MAVWLDRVPVYHIEDECASGPSARLFRVFYSQRKPYARLCLRRSFGVRKILQRRCRAPVSSRGWYLETTSLVPMALAKTRRYVRSRGPLSWACAFLPQPPLYKVSLESIVSEIWVRSTILRKCAQKQINSQFIGENRVRAGGVLRCILLEDLHGYLSAIDYDYGCAHYCD